MNYRKFVVAAVMTLPLALVACGSDEEQQAASTTKSTAATTSATTEAAPSSESATNEPTTESAPAAEESAPAAAPSEEAAPVDPAEAQAAQDALDQLANNGVVEPMNQPIPNGQAASAEDEAALRSLVNGLNGQDIRGYMIYTIDNACQSYIDQNGGRDLVVQRAEAFAALPEFDMVGRRGPNIDSIDEVSVNGDRATVRIAASYPGAAAATEYMAFKREGDRWTICPTQ